MKIFVIKAAIAFGLLLGCIYYDVYYQPSETTPDALRAVTEGYTYTPQRSEVKVFHQLKWWGLAFIFIGLVVSEVKRVNR